MTSNHGMYDFINEVLTPDGFQPYFSSSVFYDLYKYFGLNPRRPPSSPSGFENLKWYGLKRYDSGTIGGSRGADFETFFGNTGFQLLGVILERHTQTSLNSLIKKLIVEPLNIDPIIVYVDPRDADKKFADGYSIVTGDADFEQSGVYPLVALRGHKAVNNRSLGLGKPSNIDLAGGAGGLIANPRSYARFLDSLVNGGLLDRPAQRDLDNSFVRIFDFDAPTITGSNGFGLIKVRYTNDPLVPDIEWIYHNGSWPGASCWDGVIRTHNSRRTIATGVVCQNTNFFLAYPDQYFLMTGLITAIVEADKGRRP